ncbi:hypothetical protein PV05_01017 [Exophiala xenobiotica]|uniref:Major facilitator superfamily (MFS) profile domain-containing protein n=1 Tax=Exophiala xenobiotica TaxID=348802 RepID=A0A0D2C7C4_9EURO|nr:uncharacterized protein PV05_01017 [Exophiala xenobiotica]KIW60831.1 hypothetical protein PV05_01017 [Exophiala xenobiotica]
MAPSSQDTWPPLIDSSPKGRSNIEAGPEQPPSITNTESTPLLSRSAREKSSNTHYRDISGPRFIILFLSIIFGATLAFFDSTLMASSHPVITSYFHASNAASWLSTVFYLSSTVFQPLYGRVSDTIGRRPVVFFAAVMFFASTAWCAFAGSIGSFIAARAVCGLGAGGVMSMASILTSDVVKIEYRGIYQSYFNMAWGLGNGLGAALGGFICDRLGWRAAFYVQLPFIFAYAILTLVSCPPHLGPNLAKTQGKTLRQAFKTFDTFGAINLTITVTCLILGVNLGGNVFTWTHPLVITSLVLFAVAGTSLYFVERKAQLPILPLNLLSTIPLGNLMWSNFFSAIVTNTVLFNVPLYLQAVKQSSPTASGLNLLVLLVGGTVTALLCGLYITITRRMKPPMVSGTLISFIGAICVTCLSSDTPTWSVPLLIPFCSLGQGLLFPATTIAVLALNSQDEQAVVTTTLGLVRNLGAILGVAISSWVLQNALLVYLDRIVTAPDPKTKEHIIRMVRESVRAIRDLDPKHKMQVIDAYARSMRVTFALGIVISVVCILLIWPIHIPHLQRQEELDRRTEQPQDSGEEEESDEGGENEYEEAVTDTPYESVSRAITASSRRSRAAASSAAGSIPSAYDLARRPSFDTSFSM